MTPDITTIFFDVGNTLRIVLKDQAFIDKAEADLMELIQTKETHDELFAKLEERWKAYRKLSKSTLLDASEGELWTQYMLPDYDANMIFANAPKLTRLWRDHDGRRVARPDAVATLKELCEVKATNLDLTLKIKQLVHENQLLRDEVNRLNSRIGAMRLSES